MSFEDNNVLPDTNTVEGDESKTQNNELVLNLKNENEALSYLSERESSNLTLKRLIISSCDLLKVPNVIFKFKYLTDLNLSNNSIENLSKDIKNLQNLITLNLSGNNLVSLPDTLKQVYQLTYLNLSYNRFLEVPHILYYGLRNIRVLDLSFNEISRFKDPPECLSNIIELRLSNNILESLPQWIFNCLCKLQVLDVAENLINLDAQPMFNYYYSGAFETLRELNIENCNYTCERLEFLSHFKNLQTLTVGNKKELNKKKRGKNYLGNLKMDFFKNFKTIKSLSMDNTQVSVLPFDFNSMSNIEVLSLSGNLLSWLPESFCCLIHLKVLNLSSNQLLFLPNDIEKLLNLEQLHLDNNKLYQLPEGFSKLRNLKFVDLYNNNLEKVDVSFLNGENLEGVDLGLNCLDWSSCNGSLNKFEERYDCLKNVFRKRFDCLNDRVDLQNPKIKRNFDELSHDSCSTKRSISFGEDEPSDNENEAPGEANSSNENWEETNECELEEDELFDPNDVDSVKWGPTRIWGSPFGNNFCPASGHALPVMRAYSGNFKLSKNDYVEEGQFDSD